MVAASRPRYEPSVRASWSWCLLAAVIAGACSDDPDDLRDGGVRADAPAAPRDGAPPDAALLDGGSADGASIDASLVDAGSLDGGAFRLAGRVTYDHVPALDESEGGPRLGYAQLASRPARRVRVHALEGTTVLATTTTDDSGAFALEVPPGRAVRLRADAHLLSTGAVPDGIAPDACSGARWDAQVVDNTQGRAPYVLMSEGTFDTALDGIRLHAALIFRQGAYVRRSAAPFAILDSVLSVFELVCSAEPAVRLPRLALNWSADNRPTDGDTEDGEIGTSFHRQGSAGSNIYLLGREGVDTDELDDHVIAHEVGHYLESWLYRSDSGGGGHQDRDVLDPSVAFAEGWGNALSGMTFADPLYVDTKGEDQVGGFDTDVSRTPRGDDRGIYSENSAQYLLWQLFDRRDAAPDTGRFDRVHDVLRRAQRTTPALTTMVSFAAAYHAAHGAQAEDLEVLWGTDLDTPYDALCAGRCGAPSAGPDPFDVDDDIGAHYADVSPRHYPDIDGVTWPRGFWTLHAPLVPGRNAPGDHQQTRFGNYSESENKWGNNRYHRYRASRTGSATIEISSPAGASCGDDVLDLYVYRAGALLEEDESTSGCPSVRFAVRAGEDYVVQVQGLTREVASWVTTVTENKSQGPLRARLVRDPDADPETAVVRLLAEPPIDAKAPLEIRARGLDGAVVPASAREWRALPRSGEVRWAVGLPRDHAGLVVADVRRPQGPSTTVAVTVGRPGLRPPRRPLGLVVDGVVVLP